MRKLSGPFEHLVEIAGCSLLWEQPYRNLSVKLCHFLLWNFALATNNKNNNNTLAEVKRILPPILHYFYQIPNKSSFLKQRIYTNDYISPARAEMRVKHKSWLTKITTTQNSNLVDKKIYKKKKILLVMSFSIFIRKSRVGYK